MINGLYLLGADKYEVIYGPNERADIAQLVNIVTPPQTSKSIASNPSVLRDVDVIFSGWGMAKMDEAFLAAAPNLKAVFYGAGSVKGFVTYAVWQRGILITSAYAANAVPVAEYTIAAIFGSLKHVWRHAFAARRDGKFLQKSGLVGGYRSTVGLISLGMVARAVCERLRPFDLRLIAYDPFAKPDQARQLGVELVSLDQLVREADVVSLHTPWLKETEGLITGAHFAAMKPDATFINTARGAVVNEPEMIAALQQRPDLTAILDVTYPEPPAPDSPLWKMPNVILTPHIAGSAGNECRRMGRYMVEELRRYLAGEPLRWQITRELAARLA